MIHLYQDTPIGGGDALYAMSDVNINNPEDGQMLVYDASTQRWRNVTQKSLNDLAEVTDLTNIIATGTTNATGSTIPKGTFFYLNDDLCQAKADIASGATFTLNTNYEEVTAGGLNALNSKIAVETDTVGGVVFTRQGNIVSIYGYGTSPASLPTIPEKYRPNDNILFPVTAIASSKLYNAYMGLTSAGAMNCNYSSTYAGAPGPLLGGSIYFTVSYAV